MDNYINSCIQLVSYDQFYLNTLKPRLTALDLYLKENTAPFHVYDVADILDIKPDELIRFMEHNGSSTLDTTTLFSFILQSSSGICGFITRQWKYHTTACYSPEIIAEIYKLNLHKVQSAFNDLNATFVTDDELIEVFKRIHVTKYN